LRLRVVRYAVVSGGLLVFFGVVLTWPLPGLLLQAMIERLYPEMISWDGKMAWARCDSAIAGKTSWPRSSGAACQAMHLCSNEAPLSRPQEERLMQWIHDTPGCQDP